MFFSERFDIFNDSQYGFRNGKSVTLQLKDFTDVMKEILDKSSIDLPLFLDLSKAFDTIGLEHSKLLQK